MFRVFSINFLRHPDVPHPRDPCIVGNLNNTLIFRQQCNNRQCAATEIFGELHLKMPAKRPHPKPFSFPAFAKATAGREEVKGALC